MQVQREHSAILLTFIKLPFAIKIFVLSIFEWLLLKTGFTVYQNLCYNEVCYKGTALSCCTVWAIVYEIMVLFSSPKPLAYDGEQL